MTNQINGTRRSVILSTGNILKTSKKAGQKPAEELLDSLLATVQDAETEQLPNDVHEIRWKDNDLLTKLGENPRENIKIATKVFLNDCSEQDLRQAIEHAFRTLNVDFLDTLILAYHPRAGGGDTELVNGSTTPTNDADSDAGGAKEGIIEWGDGTDRSFNDLKKLWRVLEEYSENKKIRQLGISDLNCDILRQLYEWSKVQPIITQINLSACCVVPPDLKEYCNEKEIQLNTHSDPQEIITKTSLAKLNSGNLDPRWTLRYQVHVKCRGVLITKGFIVGAIAH